MKKKTINKHRISFLGMLLHKPLLFIFLILSLPVLLWGIEQTQQVISFGKNSISKVSLQQVAGSCPSSSSNSYGTIDPLEGYPAGDPPPQQNPDLNIIAMRGYVFANGEKFPIDLSSGEVGVKTPQIGKITQGRPTIVSLYKINSWIGDFRSGKRGVPMPVPDDPAAAVKQIQMIGIKTTPGERIKLPPVYGNPISPEYNAMVLFANENFITVKYTREDNIGIKNGYAIQIDGICVDPKLLELYNQLNSSGRGNLPALSNEQELGTGKESELRVVIRDTGDFLDPRSKLDWWQGIDYPPVPTDVVQKPIPTQRVVAQFTTTAPQPTQPIINQPSAPLPPQPTAILLSPTTIINVQPTQPQSPLIVLPPDSTPTPTPTPHPFIDVGKTMEDAKSVWKRIVTSVIKFTLVILP